MPRLFLRMLAPLGMAFGLYVNNAAAGVGAVGGGALSAFARPSPVQTVQAGECWNENGPDGPGYYPCGDGGGGPIVGPSIGRPDGHGAGGVSPSPASPGLAGVHGANGATGGRVGAPASPGVAGSAPAAPHMAAPASPVGSAPAASHIAAPASPRPAPARWAPPILARLPHPASRAFMASEGAAAAPSRRAASDVGERAERVGRPVRPTGVRRSNPGQATDRSAQDFRRRRPSGRRPSVRRRGRPRAHRGQ